MSSRTSAALEALPADRRLRLGRGRNESRTRLTNAPRRRRIPYLLLGVLLVVVCAAGGVVLAAGIGDRASVLVLARDVSAGQRLQDADLRQVRVAKDTDLHTVPAGQSDQVTGRPVAYSVPAGTLLTKEMLGTAKVPSAGQAIAARALKAGQFPPDLQAGQHVAVVAVPEDSDGDGKQPKPITWPATVVEVRPDARAQSTVIALELAAADATALAGFPSEQVTLAAVRDGGS